MFKRWFVLMLALCLLLTSTSVAFMEGADTEALPAEAIEEVLLDSADEVEDVEEFVEEVEDDFGVAEGEAPIDEETFASEEEAVAESVVESVEETADAAEIVITADAAQIVEPTDAGTEETPAEEPVVAESADEAAKAVAAEAAPLAEAAPAGSKPARVSFTRNGTAVAGTITVNKGDSFTLVPVATTATGLVINDIGFKWKSSKKKVASCAGGVIKAKKVGTTKVTVTTKRGKKKASIKIKVIDPFRATKVELSDGNVFMFKGTTLQVTASLKPVYSNSTVKWTSSNKKVARVTKTGPYTATIKARKKGKAVITCKTSSGKKARVTVKVIKKGGAAKDLIAENSPDEVVYRNSIGYYGISTNPFNANANIVWTSSNPNVLSVVGSARSGDLSFWCDVQGMSLGSATLTGTDTVTGKSVSYFVPVQDPPPPESINLPMGGVVTVSVGGRIDVPYEVLPTTSLASNYNRATVTYDQRIASITYDSANADRNCLGTSDYNLHITGIAPGSCTVTITLGNGVSASFTLVVA